MKEEVYLRPDEPLPYCKGCGHGVVLRALEEALETLRLPPSDLAIVTDIGCVGLSDALFATPHTVHTTHGRSTAFATGLALADSVLGAGRLKPIVMIGDGGAMIGIGHLVTAALLNPDVTVLLHNNFLFGMTGGQNSAFSPLDFITSTTPAGNVVPPLDLARVLMASRASFVARKTAGDRDLTEVIARAIAHPGFALVEILELCTAHATRKNALTGARLKEVADRAGYEMGVLRDERRPKFDETCRGRFESPGPDRRRELALGRFASPLKKEIGVLVAGTAGEHVQTAASLLATAAILSGLRVTQKNDNPVTQGTGFSVSEVLMSPEEILFTGIERPEVIVVVSAEGARELAGRGDLSRAAPPTLVLADEDVPLPPEVAPLVRRSPFRRAVGGKLAALAAIAQWLGISRLVPVEALWSAIEIRFGAEAGATRSALTPFVGTD